jgi:SAM-dependent methyltransferase
VRLLRCGSIGQNPIFVSEETLALGERLAVDLNRLLGNSEYESSLASMFSIPGISVLLNLATDSVGQAGPNVRCALEIGCGSGLFQVAMSQFGWRVFGIDKGQGSYAISLRVARSLLRDNNLSDELVFAADARSLPFKDSSFDVVMSRQVLEHIGTRGGLIACLNEVWRVLKVGGRMISTVPNYRFPYEAHYGVILPTLLGKSICRFCLRVLHKRPPSFFDDILLVNPTLLKSSLRDAQFRDFAIQPSYLSVNPLKLHVESAELPFRFLRGSLRAKKLFEFWKRHKQLFRLLGVYPEILVIGKKT